MKREEIEARKKRLQLLQEAAREKTREAGMAVQRAEEYEKKLHELERKEENSQAQVS